MVVAVVQGSIALVILDIKSKIGTEMIKAIERNESEDYIQGLKKSLEIVEQVEEEVLGDVDCRKN